MSKHTHTSRQNHIESRSTSAERQGHASAQEVKESDSFDSIIHALPTHSRAFSRFIHIPAVESISDLLAVTIARPLPLFLGGLSALIGGIALYGYAKYAGFALQGSEILIAFAVGWTVGLICDIAKTLFVRRKS